MNQIVIDASAGAVTSGLGQAMKAVKQANGGRELNALKRQLDRAERVAGENPRSSRATRVSTTKNMVESYGNAAQSSVKASTAFVLGVVKGYYEKDE